MKKLTYILSISVLFLSIFSCDNNRLTYINPEVKIIFLHHSTGFNVWKGELRKYAKYTKWFTPSLVPKLLKSYNETNDKKYSIRERSFPTRYYSWENYPFDYYNIWVKNADKRMYKMQPTLKKLAKKYDVIIFKNCFPYSHILADDSLPDINSRKKTISNYTLQYNALKHKLLKYPDTKFIIWTGAALVEKSTSPEHAKRAMIFHDWVVNEWDQPGDNIFFFDFRKIETKGGLYLKPEYAVNEYNSHPNELLSGKAAELFVNRIIEVIENSN